MAVANCLKSALTLACVACLSMSTFATTWTVVEDEPDPVSQHLKQEIVINSNHKITVEGELEHSYRAAYNYFGVVAHVYWINSSEHKRDFKITEVIKYTEDGMEVEETNIFSEIEHYYYSPSGGNVKTEIIDGKKYITNSFRCFYLSTDFMHEAEVMANSDDEPVLYFGNEYWMEGEYNGKTQSYDPTEISSRSVFKGIFFKSSVHWHQRLTHMSADGTVDPNDLHFKLSDNSLVSTTRVILNLAGSQNELGMFANNFSWTYTEYEEPY